MQKENETFFFFFIETKTANGVLLIDLTSYRSTHSERSIRKQTTLGSLSNRALLK